MTDLTPDERETPLVPCVCEVTVADVRNTIEYGARYGRWWRRPGLRDALRIIRQLQAVAG